MKLKVKNVELSTGGPLIVVLNKEDSSKLDLHGLDRIKIEKDGKYIVAVVNICENKNIKSGEIGFFEEVTNKLKIKEDELIDVSIENKPNSINFIKKKLDKKELTNGEINEIIKDVVDNKISEVELSFFVSACYTHGLSLNESVDLTNAIVNNGAQLKLERDIILDKHGTGGTPGNRTSMIIVPIIAAAGIAIPKTSSRAITSAAGTADVMEVLADVSFPTSKIKEIVEKTNGCLVWCGAMDLASADDKIIKMEHPLSLDPEGILLSSIMAKKKAVGATHVLVDIAYGIGAKIETVKRASHLKKMFYKLGKRLGIKIEVIMTDGTQPIGNGIGSCLEARDVLYVLMNDVRAPKDLKEKSIHIAGLMLRMVGKGNQETAREILESGKAYEKFKEIIKAQNGNSNIKPEELKIGEYNFMVKAKKNGTINKIDNKALIRIARIAGAPSDKEAGIYLKVHKGDKVKEGDILLTVYAQNDKRLNYTLEIFNKTKIIEIQ